MSSPLEQAGATREPSEYAALTMDRGITGLWTQRSPLRDADVPYLYGKFYSASRFDSIIDGINREITAKLTWRRRPGTSVYNANTFPAINSFYPYKCIQNGVEVLRVIADGADGNIYDATAGQQATLFAKSAGAAKARFAGVNTELFFADGIDLEKWLFPPGWQASTNFAPGTLINVGAKPGKIQMALGGMSLPIIATASTGSAAIIYVDPQQIPLNFANLQNVMVTFSALTAGSYLNGNSYPVQVQSSNLGILTINVAHAAYLKTADTGTGSTGTGISGGSAPTFSTTGYAITADGGQQWKCYGSAIQNWGLQKPKVAPNVSQLGNTRFWLPSFFVGGYYSILDQFGRIQATVAGGQTGLTYPVWAAQLPSAVAQTTDNGVLWQNLGTVGFWIKSTGFGGLTAGGLLQTQVILDSNGNLQWATGNGTSGAGAHPAWATTIGVTTADGSVTWTCLGPGTVITSATIQYAFSTHAIDGSVSTASPVLTIYGGILGPSGPAGASSQPLLYLQLNFNFVADPQIDQIWFWRTAQGQSILVLEDQIPVDTIGSVYYELGVPDTSSNGSGALVPQVPAPIALSNNPPPVGMTAPLYHLGRMWAIYQNTVIVSGGPNTIVGNGNTAFAPLSFFPIPEQPIRLFSTITSAGPGILVWGRANIYIILGQGTPNNPFQQAARYMAGCGILNYDAVTQIGSTYYAFGNTALLGGKLVGKAFSLDPGAGYVEYGFPIGDQFANVSTGTLTSSLSIVSATYTASGTTVALQFNGPPPSWLTVGAKFNVSLSDSRFNTGTIKAATVIVIGAQNYVQYIENLGGGNIAQEAVTGTVALPTGYLYNPATTYVTWAELGSGDTALYVADGSIGWFRYSPVASPEAGFLWSPRTAIVGGTSAVQGVETQPGVTQLLIGPSSSGPILFRDSTVSGDWFNGASVAYPSYDVKGCIQLCLSGEVAEVAHVHVVSMPLGSRPKVGLLFGEILPSVATPFAWYDPTSSEPPNLKSSVSVYSDRYSMLSKGVTPKCLFFQLGMDYGAQLAADETLMFSVFGAKFAERRQQ